MNCKNCNSPLSEGTVFCPNCGQKYEGETVAPVAETEATPVAEVPMEPIETPKIVEPEVAPISQINESTSVVTSETKKNSSVGLIIVIIILSLLVLGLGGFIAFKFLFPQTPSTEPTPSTPTTTTPTTTTTTTTTTDDEDYMVAGDSTLGYVKLPGEWTKTRIAGADEKSLQYTENKTYTGSTATGSWIVTLNTSSLSNAKTAAEAEAAYYKAYDSDATNIKVESAKMGKYDAYKLYCQYKSDNVWVVTWYFEAEDGKVHIIQVEGLDLTKDYFKIPESFSLTKIN